MGTDALSLLITVALFILGLWLIIAIAKGLFLLLGWVLVVATVIWFIRWLTSRRA
jgi:hypothetical protein